jgi:hypothetical protein
MSGLEKLLRQVELELAHPQASRDAMNEMELSITLRRGEWERLANLLRVGRSIVENTRR